jgi:hypothetical protein
MCEDGTQLIARQWRWETMVSYDAVAKAEDAILYIFTLLINLSCQPKSGCNSYREFSLAAFGCLVLIGPVGFEPTTT